MAVGNRPKTRPHPASAGVVSLAPTKEDRDVMVSVAQAENASPDLEKLPGWGGFSESRKRYLELLPLFKTSTDLSLYIGRHKLWGTREVGKSQIFKRAVAIRRTQKIGLMKAFTERLWVRAQMELGDLLQHKDPKIRLQTIGLLARLNGGFGKGAGGSSFGLETEDDVEVTVPHSSLNGKGSLGEDSIG